MTLYDTLGVPKDADAVAIKRAYRKRAKQSHPDAGGSAEAFSALHRSYLVLSDPMRRAKYDRDGTVDADATNDPLAQAAGIILQFFSSVVPRAVLDANVFSLDLVEQCRKHLRLERDQIRQNRLQAENMIKTWEKLIKKLTRKQKRTPDLVARGMRFHADSLKVGIAQADQQIQMRTDALKLLDDYSFDADAASRIYSSHIFRMPTTWTTT